MAEPGGVLIARPDGVIDVPEAVPWPEQFARQVEQVLDGLGAPRPSEQRQRKEGACGRTSEEERP